jgi:hypothetical protein
MNWVWPIAPAHELTNFSREMWPSWMMRNATSNSSACAFFGFGKSYAHL